MKYAVIMYSVLMSNICFAGGNARISLDPTKRLAVFELATRKAKHLYPTHWTSSAKKQVGGWSLASFTKKASGDHVAILKANKTTTQLEIDISGQELRLLQEKPKKSRKK